MKTDIHLLPVPLLRGLLPCLADLIIISSRSSAILETSKPLKSSATAHARITKSLFQHFKSFTSRFTQSPTELDAHPLFVNFLHNADIRKSQTADAIRT